MKELFSTGSGILGTSFDIAVPPGGENGTVLILQRRIAYFTTILPAASSISGLANAAWLSQKQVSGA